MYFVHMCSIRCLTLLFRTLLSYIFVLYTFSSELPFETGVRMIGEVSALPKVGAT